MSMIPYGGYPVIPLRSLLSVQRTMREATKWGCAPWTARLLLHSLLEPEARDWIEQEYPQ